MTEIEDLQLKLSDTQAELYFTKNICAKFFADRWMARGIPSTVLDKLNPILLSDNNFFPLRFFDELFSEFAFTPTETHTK